MTITNKPGTRLLLEIATNAGCMSTARRRGLQYCIVRRLGLVALALCALVTCRFARAEASTNGVAAPGGGIDVFATVSRSDIYVDMANNATRSVLVSGHIAYRESSNAWKIVPLLSTDAEGYQSAQILLDPAHPRAPIGWPHVITRINRAPSLTNAPVDIVVGYAYLLLDATNTIEYIHAQPRSSVTYYKEGVKCGSRQQLAVWTDRMRGIEPIPPPGPGGEHEIPFYMYEFMTRDQQKRQGKRNLTKGLTAGFSRAARTCDCENAIIRA